MSAMVSASSQPHLSTTHKLCMDVHNNQLVKGVRGLQIEVQTMKMH